MEKKDGGNISHWQIHNLKFEEKDRATFEFHRPNLDFDNIRMVTGTVVDEPTQRWKPGDHFRSSMIVEIDRDKNTIETENTIYHFDPETENQDGMPDLGNGVLSIFY
jgi:hypothetical protein